MTLHFTDVDDDGQTKALGYAMADEYDSPALKVVEPGHVLWDLRSDERWLFAIVRVRFENTSSYPLTVETGPAFRSFGHGRITQRVEKIRLSAQGAESGSTRPIFLAVGTRVSNWIDASRSPDRAAVVAAATSWSTDVEGETGVMVSQLIKIQGTLLESGPEDGTYTLRTLGPDPAHNYPSRLVIEKQKRHYFVGLDEDGDARTLPPVEMSDWAKHG